MITKRITWIVALGCLWGVAELGGKDLLADLGLQDSSLWLTGCAVLALSVSRGLWNRAGSSATIGLVAAAVRFAGPSTNYCHLLGIASLGLLFDLFASSLLRDGSPSPWRIAVVGMGAVYGARAVFVLYLQHIAHYQSWVEGGSEMAVDHVLRSGSLVALAALVLAPLGFRIGARLGNVLTKAVAVDPSTAAQR